MKIINYFILVSIIFIPSIYATPFGGGPIGGGSAIGGSGDITQVGTCTTGACTTDFINDTAIDFSSVTLNDLTFDVGSVSKTEFGYLDGVTSSIQNQLDALAGGGGAPLDATYWVGSANGTLSAEIVVNDETSLYNALSDVSDFVQTEEINTVAKLESVSNGGAYMSDLLSCANLQAVITLLQAGDWTFGAASDIDMSGANSVTMGPLQLGANADFGDYDVTSVDKLEGVDSGTYIDVGVSGVVEVGGGLQAKPRYQTDAAGAITIIVNAINYGTDTGDADIPDGACDAAGDVGNWVVLISDTADQYSLTSNDASNLFILDDNTSLDAGDELDVDGTMVSVMCVEAEKWKVVGYIDTAPTDGGVAD